MKRLLRAAVVIILSLLFASIIWYHNNGERMWAELRARVQLILSETAGNPVTFSGIRFSPPFSLTLDEIKVFSADTKEIIAKIKRVAVTPEILPLFTENLLRLNIRVVGLESNDISARFSVRLDLPKNDTWEETFQSPEINTLHLSRGVVKFKEYNISGLTGTLELENGDISGGEVLFTFRKEDLLLSFQKIVLEETYFSGIFRSKDYTLKGRFFPEKDILVIENFKGNIFSLNADISGKIEDLSKSGERSLEIKGYLGGGIKNLLSLVLDKEKAEDPAFNGSTFSSAFEARFKENDLKNISLSARIKADKLPLKNMDIQKISGKVTIDSGRLSVSNMDFSLGNYPAKLDLSMDMYSEDLPLSFTASASKMDLASALNGIDVLENKNYGPIDLNISFAGSGKNLYTAASYFTKTGAIYPDGNVFKGMEMSGLIKLKNYKDEKNRFDDITAEFSLKDGVLSASNIFFRSFGGEFSGKGGISFLEQNMPISADVSVKAADTKLLPEDLFGKNNSAEGPIKLDISLKGPGKLISEFFKKDTYGKNDTLTPPFKKFWRRSLLPEFRYRLKDVDLACSANVTRLRVEDIKIENLKANIALDNGTISSSDFSFRAFGGNFSGKADISPSERAIPLHLELALNGLSPSSIPKNIIDISQLRPGTIDLDVSFSGSGHFLSDMIADLGKENEKTGSTGPQGFWRKALKSEYRDALARTKAKLKFNMSSMYHKDILINNIVLNSEFIDGTLQIPYFSLSSLGGTLSGSGQLEIDYADFPFMINTLTKQVDLSEVSRIILASPGLADGPADIAFSYSGYGRILSEISTHMSILEKKYHPAVGEKLHSALLFMSAKRLFKGQFFKSSFSLKTIRAGKVRFDNFFGDLVFSEGRFSVPNLTGIFYKGLFSCNLASDLNTLGFPFTFNAEIKRSDLMSLIRDTIDKKSDVHGNLDFNVQAFGKAEYQTTYSGEGALAIYDANLGRVPILTPLLGWIYESLEDVFPAFKKINIDTAGASFEIKDRKLITDNLVLSGSDICLVSQGSLDFDGRLDFSFENELIEQKIPEDADWPVSIRNFITSFGKTISRARLRGTLQDQKWEFEYLAPVREAISENVRSFFEGLSQ